VLERDLKVLMKLNLDELGAMMNKWRETDRLVPFKSKMNKAARLDAILAAVERERERLLRELVKTLVKLADVEAGEDEAEHEDLEGAPVDEDMND
jgi:septal ring factor EnvC (AmiA/AmiB activator)